MKNAKKYAALMLALGLAFTGLTGCGQRDAAAEHAKEQAAAQTQDAPKEEAPAADAAQDTPQEEAPAAEEAPASDFDSSQSIGVITREEGSGTRGAFVELFGIEQKNDAGEKVDYTTDAAEVTNSTSVMMTTVAGDPYAIGYISLGSLNDTVKAVSIDGAAPSVATVSSGEYKIARPFNIATKEGLSDVAQDFIDFIMSADGQAVIEENGYIKVSDAPAYAGKMDSGKIVVSGSSSVTPVMEKLREAYLAKNAGVTIEVQQSDSSTGMSNTIDGACDIGMASRDLKDSETEKGLSATVIAMDGIAVIVNNGSPVSELSSEQVKSIYMGEAYAWSDLGL